MKTNTDHLETPQSTQIPCYQGKQDSHKSYFMFKSVRGCLHMQTHLPIIKNFHIPEKLRISHTDIDYQCYLNVIKIND